MSKRATVSEDASNVRSPLLTRQPPLQLQQQRQTNVGSSNEQIDVVTDELTNASYPPPTPVDPPTKSMIVDRHGFWLFALNFVAMITHFAFAVLTLGAGAGKAGMEIRVYRVKAVFTGTDTIERGGIGYTAGAVDNNMPVRIELVTSGFFALSFVAHLFACLCYIFYTPKGLFERVYYEQMAQCFLWWRWVEYFLSAPLMAFGLGLIVGIREQNALASVWMLVATTMFFGFLTELAAVPVYEKRTLVVGAKGTFVEGDRKEYIVSYWRGDDPYRNSGRKALVNWVYRLVPHVLGLFPFVGAWVLLVNTYVDSMRDLEREQPLVYLTVEKLGFIPFALMGSLVAFSSFTFPQIIFQSLAPSRYFLTEYVYVTLSLIAKVYLGSLLFVNVLRADSVDRALAGDTSA